VVGVKWGNGTANQLFNFGAPLTGSERRPVGPELEYNFYNLLGSFLSHHPRQHTAPSTQHPAPSTNPERDENGKTSTSTSPLPRHNSFIPRLIRSFQLNQDQEKDVEVTWGMRAISPKHRTSRLIRAYPLPSGRVTEDQQRINNFSKYNIRLQRITDQLEKTQVGHLHQILCSTLLLKKQLEKEALDDVAMDIELADDEKPVMCVDDFVRPPEPDSF
jgi:hypothetical protein